MAQKSTYSYVVGGSGANMNEQPRGRIGTATASLSHASDSELLTRLSRDFTAILIGYNIPREDARRVAAQAVEPVRQHLVMTGSVLRLCAFNKLD